MKPLFTELQLFFKDFSHMRFLIFYFLFVELLKSLYFLFGKNVLKNYSDNHIHNIIIVNRKLTIFKK